MKKDHGAHASDTERSSNTALSTVVGIVLLIAIAVVIASLVATFALDLSGTVDEEARAGVAVDRGGYNLTVSVVTLDNSDYVLIRGAEGLRLYETPASVPAGEPVGSDDVFVNRTSTRITLGSGGAPASGTLFVVAVMGEKPDDATENGGLVSAPPPETATETVVREVEYDLAG